MGWGQKWDAKDGNHTRKLRRETIIILSTLDSPYTLPTNFRYRISTCKGTVLRGHINRPIAQTVIDITWTGELCWSKEKCQAKYSHTHWLAVLVIRWKENFRRMHISNENLKSKQATCRKQFLRCPGMQTHISNWLNLLQTEINWLLPMSGHVTVSSHQS